MIRDMSYVMWWYDRIETRVVKILMLRNVAWYKSAPLNEVWVMIWYCINTAICCDLLIQTVATIMQLLSIIRLYCEGINTLLGHVATQAVVLGRLQQQRAQVWHHHTLNIPYTSHHWLIVTTSYHIISYHIISYHIISYRFISYHIISYHIISYHIISYHIISYHIISYHIISYHIISYHITSYHIISYHIISYHIISYHDTSNHDDD